MGDPSKSGYSINNIVLVESHFVRTDNIVDDKTVTNNVDIGSDYNIKGKQIFCIVTLNFQSIYKKTLQIDATIRMVGVFDIIGKPKLGVKPFAQASAPAIMFPYLREHLSSMSVKAALKPINLPPVNFVALSEQKKKK